MSTREPETPKASLGFPRSARITQGAELQRIMREGKRIRTIYMEVRVAASPLPYLERSQEGLRVGFVVPLLKHSAVARNQLKRRLRELVRLQLLPTGLPIDVVLRIHSGAYGATFGVLQTDFSGVVAQIVRRSSSIQASFSRDGAKTSDTE